MVSGNHFEQENSYREIGSAYSFVRRKVNQRRNSEARVLSSSYKVAMD